jgi:hypothetical protein
VRGIVGEFFDISLLRVLRQPTGETADKTFGRSHGLS